MLKIEFGSTFKKKYKNWKGMLWKEFKLEVYKNGQEQLYSMGL